MFSSDRNKVKDHWGVTDGNLRKSFKNFSSTEQELMGLGRDLPKPLDIKYAYVYTNLVPDP